MTTQTKQHLLELDTYHDSVKTMIPMITISAKQDGPTLVLMAGQHGRELNGIEVIRRSLPLIEEKLLRGTCICVPCVNQMAVRMRQQDFPLEAGRYFNSAPSFNLNRVWPGKKDGTLNEALAYALWENAISKADGVVDLHGWTGMSHSLAWGTDEELVRAFGLEIHQIRSKNADGGIKTIDGMLEQACFEHGIANLTVELTPQNKLCERSIQAGARGVRNIMRKLEMMPGSFEFPEQQIECVDDAPEHPVIAQQGGLLVPLKETPALLKKGDVFAEIVKLDNVKETFPLTSPIDGALFNVGGLPWAEHIVESSIVDAGTVVALVKNVSRIIKHDQ